MLKNKNTKYNASFLNIINYSKLKRHIAVNALTTIERSYASTCHVYYTTLHRTCIYLKSKSLFLRSKNAISVEKYLRREY